MKLLQIVGLSLATILLISACGGLSKKNNSPTSSPVNETEDTNTTMSTSQKAMKRITEYAKNGGTAPTIQDYKDAGINGIDSEAKLAEINQVIERLEEKDVDSIKEVQSIANSVSVEVSTDTKAPLITIIGGKTISIKQNTIYTDAGATAVDDKDGNVTVSSKGSVDSNTTGIYTITYTATDSTGNSATVTRTVTVEISPDTTLPVITLIGGTTTNVLQFSRYIEAGATANDNIDGNISLLTTGIVDTNATGVYDINYTATDSAGNSVTATRTVTVKAFSIIHNGTTYGAVVSPYTGKVWLDRNLGAAQVCTSYNDTACYGDYYQWGRNFDGHQDSTSSVIDKQATDINSAGNSFITSSSEYSYEWIKNVDSDGRLRSTNWSKIDGSSVCPVGYRVPTGVELQKELLVKGSAQIKNHIDAFKSFLKLPSSGYRGSYSGLVNFPGQWGGLWSSSVDGSNSYLVSLYIEGPELYGSSRADGVSVRCLRD